MSDQVLSPAPRAERRRHRRRRTDVDPLFAGVVVAAVFALLFHAIPGGDELHALRVVLTGIGVVTACMLLALLLLDRFARAPSGHGPGRHPGRRSGDRGPRG